MSSYNAVILGGSSGFGKYITTQLLKQKKFKITIIGLNKPNKKNHKLKFLRCNLYNIHQLKNCIQKLKKNNKKIDILILNSGCFFLKKEMIYKKYEKTFLVNFLSQYFLILSLKKKILNSDLKKIFIISSHVIFNSKININDIQSLMSFNFWNSYKNSKTLLFLACKDLFNKDKKKISYFFFNPGRIKTKLGSNLKIIGKLISLYHYLFGEKPENISRIFNKFLNQNLYKHKLFKFSDFNSKVAVLDDIEKKLNKKKLIQNVNSLSKNF